MDIGMVRKKSCLLASIFMGMSLLFAGCGDDLNAVVPLESKAVVENESTTEAEDAEGKESSAKPDNEASSEEESSPSSETLETQEDASTEEKDQENNQENTQDESQEVVLPKEVTITISAAGDCSLGNHHEQDYYYSFNQAYDKAEDPGYFFANVKEIFETDDMTIVNLEGVFTESEDRQVERTFNIKGAPSYVGILTAGSVEAVSMGNNHRLDYGVAGSDDTVATLEGE